MTSLARVLSVATSTAASACRPTFGNFASAVTRRPTAPLELYEFEACPFCRKAREAASMLALDVLVFPCPKGGPTYRAKATELGGRSRFPFLVDPNTGARIYESDAIVAYLFSTYGDGRVPWSLRIKPFALVTSALASGARLRKGFRYRPARKPKTPLELYSYEGSPYCRLVREELSALEIPYLLHNVPRKSQGRAAFVARSGKMQVPWLVDPNTGVEMFESDAIVRYLRRTYSV